MDTAAIISKAVSDLGIQPNFTDYEAQRRRFSWDALTAELSGPGENQLNLAWAAVERHLAGLSMLRDKPALRFISRDDADFTLSYAELGLGGSRFANVLRKLGVGRGECVVTLTERIPTLYLAVLGTLKYGAIVAPLSPAGGADASMARIKMSQGRVLVTTDRLYQSGIAGRRERMPTLRHVLLVAEDGGPTQVPGTLDLASLMDSVADEHEAAPTSATDAALLHFTGGTTGAPKAVIHGHGVVAAHFATSKFALDLHRSDIFWSTAALGTITGTAYGIIAPLLHGVTAIVDREAFDAERWYGILQKQKVTVWYAASGAIRQLMAAGRDIPARYRFPQLRLIASMGDALNPQAVWWGKRILDLPIHDNWWQTETGGIAIANTPGFDIKPGSLGRPLPGIEAAIVSRTESGGVRLIDTPDSEGELAFRPDWPGMFADYRRSQHGYRTDFADGWYLTGDLAQRDADGYYWFIGRASDVIRTAGHLVGPLEVENALLEHPAVAEAGAVGKPDPVAGEVVKVFVALKPGFSEDESLRLELLGHARKSLGAAVAPTEIGFLPRLPRTSSGKIKRRVLKSRELGLPEDDDIGQMETGG